MVGPAAAGQVKPSATKPALPCRLGLSPSEFAYLRSIAQGIDKDLAAKHYLGVIHGHAVITAHRLVIDRAQSIARRRRDPRWRLLGALIPNEPATDAPLSVEEWAAQEGLQDYSWNDLLELHAERFASAPPDARRSRVVARNARLMRQRLQLLNDLQAAGAKPQPSDTVDGWLAPRIAEALARAGVMTLEDLRRRIAVGGRWWSILPAFGVGKAGRLAAQVGDLLGPPGANRDPQAWQLDAAINRLLVLEAAPGENRAPLQPSGTAAAVDRSAIESWLDAKARSPMTRASYRRESERFLFWLAVTRGVDLAGARASDCAAYMRFLGNVPQSWHSRHGAARLTPGWAPFRGALKIASQQLALTIVSSFYAWLVRAGYLLGNPWVLVSIRLGDDPERSLDDPTSRAFTPAAWSALHAELAAIEPARAAAAARLRWLIVFCSMTGLRISEVIRARRRHLKSSRQGWTLDVFGKGRKARVAIVPTAAIEATRAYFTSRLINFDEAPEAFLLAPIGERAQASETPAPAAHAAPTGPVSYTATYKAMQGLVRGAARRLPPDEQVLMERATLHWLRHTFGTRAAEAGVSPNDLQEQLGQADPRMAARYSRAQIQHRATALEKIVLTIVSETR